MKHTHGGNIKEIVEKYNIEESEIIDFSTNINFLGPPADIIKKLKKNLKKIQQYPEKFSDTLKKKISEKYRINTENIIGGNGAAALIFELVRNLKIKSGLVLAPTFSEYELALNSIGAQVEYFNLKFENGFQFKLKNFLDKLKKNKNEIDIIFLCNPNNPTGKIINRNDLTAIIEGAQKFGIMTVVDEAFIDFVKGMNQLTVLNLIKHYKNLVVLRSFTKFYAIPGLRLGFGAGPVSFMKKVDTNRAPWNVNILAQKAGKVILENEDKHDYIRAKINKEKDFLQNGLQKITGFTPFKSFTNYLLVDISNTGKTSTELFELLAQKKILIRDCSSFKNLDKDYIRLSVKNHSHNKYLLNILNKLF